MKGRGHRWKRPIALYKGLPGAQLLRDQQRATSAGELELGQCQGQCGCQVQKALTGRPTSKLGVLGNTY